ncbi:MAG: ABC transporter permease [Candidatus Marinimicrobia bacterium]|nr:ABC transporter permease [Candidatus Neomarinimicrobiota bacterium]
MINILIENLKIALVAIGSNRSRSLLTTLGIIIGILAVTLMGTLISGLDRSFEKSLSFMARDVLFITKHKWFGNEDWWEVRNRRNMKVEYADMIKDISDYAIATAPIVSRISTIKYKEKSVLNVRTTGTTDEYLQTTTITIENGRFFTAGENRAGSPICVIGYDVAQELFENMDPIGKKIKFGPHQLRIIGVIEKQGKFLGLFSLDNQAIVPLGTFQRMFARRGWTQINVKVPMTRIEEAKDELTSIMRRIRGLRPQEENDFAINQQEAFRDRFNMMKMAIGGTGVFITILSLVVGGIGIMNIMFVSVRERTREIGIRKALGATPRVILLQFLFEAVIICGMAGLIGLGLSYVGSIVIDKFVFPSTMPLWLTGVAFGLSLIVGVISGLGPASKAARQNPIEALRYE